MRKNYSKINSAPFGLQLPIKLIQEDGSNLWTWYLQGLQMRYHFASGFWYSEDGDHVLWAWQDWQNHELTKLKVVEILSEASGREFVEVKKQGEESLKQYLDEAVCTCFHAKSKPGQVVHHKDGDINNCNSDNLIWR